MGHETGDRDSHAQAGMHHRHAPRSTVSLLPLTPPPFPLPPTLSHSLSRAHAAALRLALSELSPHHTLDDGGRGMKQIGVEATSGALWHLNGCS